MSLALVPAAVAADGELDQSYGAGAVTVSVGSSFSNAWDIAIQGDDHAVLAGTASQGFPTWGFARVDTAGVLDPSFDGDGKLSKEVGNGGSARAVVLEPGGKILAGGDASGDGTDARPYLPRFALVRLTAGGTPDADFGTAGVVTTPVGGDPGATGVGGGIEALALQPDGKIVAAGYAYWSGQARFLIARYTSTGDLDLPFGGGDGMVDVPFAGGSGGATGVVIQPGGAIVVSGGAFDATAGDNVFTLTRLTPGGVLDGSFGTGGIVATAMPGRGTSGGAAAEALLQQADGGLVAAGWTNIDPGVSAFAIARYSAGGVLDTGFGTGGTTVTHFNANELAKGFGAHLQSDGKVVVAGEAENAITGVRDVALARYTTGGQLDPGFGSGGLTTAGVAGTTGGARGIAAQSDGKYVIDGYRGGQFLAQRFTGSIAVPAPPVPPAPPPDPAPLPAGICLPGTSAGVTCVALGAGQKITGTSGNDVIIGTPGKDVISCGRGNDRVTAGAGDDIVACGDGNDRLDGGLGNDRMDGGAGKDLVNGQSGNDPKVSGGSGNDKVNGGGGKDRVAGGAGNDRVYGGSGNDRVNGNSGDDRLWGGSGNDTLIGGPGRDRLNGGTGTNRLVQ
jgi:uncharacterized delta-60 repeat protein